MLFAVGQSTAINSGRTPDELSFLHAVEFSDITTARRLIAEDPQLNVDVIDALGRTALRLAVRNENREIVEMLLEHCNSQNIGQAVLQAISEEHTSIAELMLKHPCYLEICRKRKRLGDTDGFFKTEVESQFSTDMTPLNLAAQKNNYTIVQLLLQRGETIPKPHKFSCNCMECRNRIKFDQLRMANFRLNAYRGLASEAYISLSSEDPILTGFQLAKELSRLSNDEKHFKKEYKDLSSRLSVYLVKLLDRVWTQEELRYVLNKKGPPGVERYENLARLKMALENKEKKFVAHPSVQQHLVKIWHNDLSYIENHGLHVRLPIMAFLSLAYPFIVLGYFVKPKSKWTVLAKQPMVKFLGHTVSFLIFLLLLIISSIESSKRVSNTITLRTHYADIATPYRQYREALGENVVPYGEDFPLRPLVPTITEYLITIWIVGMMLQEVLQVLKSGVKAHFHDLYNVVDFCLLTGYIAAFSLFHWTMHQSRVAITALNGKNCSMMLADRTETDFQLYFLNTDRNHWESMDPINMAEALFAMANIVSFSRIINIMPANEALGPMQISLGRMVGDFVKFFVFTSIAVVAFIVSLRNLYWWYSDTADQNDPDARDDASTSFKNFVDTFRTVFWWIYGRGSWDHALDVPQKYTDLGVADITMEVGMVLAGLYHITIIIVLVNLLIAMMARSFEKIVEDVDVEWKYARSVLYMEYINEGIVPPVPFNLFQPLRDIIVAVNAGVRALCRKKKMEDEEEITPPTASVITLRRPGIINLGFLDSPSKLGSATNGKSHSLPTLRSMTASTIEEKPTYIGIAETIVQRYIFDIQREQENSTDNVEEARHNLFNAKWDLLELMDKRDNTVCHLTACLKDTSASLSAAPDLLPQTQAPSKPGTLPARGDAEGVCPAPVTRRRRWSGSSLGNVKEEEDDSETQDGTGYPKTRVIISGSKI